MANPLEHNRDGGYQARAEQAAIQHARALVAAEANSPEAIAAEAARQEVRLAAEAAEWRAAERAISDANGEPYRPEILEPSPVLEPTGLDEDGSVPTPRKSRLAEALSTVLEDPDEVEDEEVEELPAEVMGGAHLIRWILLPAEENDGWTLGLGIESNEDEQPDAVYLEVTQAMMRKWRNAPANANDLERFAAGLMEKVADSLAEDLTDNLIVALERITRGELREKQHLLDVPTETSIGPDDDGPFADAPDNADEVPDEPVPFGSIDEYVQARDSYAQTLSREDYSAFLDDNQDLEDQIERMANEGG